MSKLIYIVDGERRLECIEAWPQMAQAIDAFARKEDAIDYAGHGTNVYTVEIKAIEAVEYEPRKVKLCPQPI